MRDREVTAIVLAGGRSTRFGRDKLAEPMDGVPLLLHAVEAARSAASEILVVVRPGAQPDFPPDVRVVHDPTPFEGPLVGLLAGLRAATDDTVLVAAGDTPVLVPAVLDALLSAFERGDADAVLLARSGRPEPFPMVLRRQRAQEVAERLVEAGERRLLALTEVLSIQVIDEATWRSLDPDGHTVHDIDTPADLP